jgi:hypothetical protein
MVIRCPSFARSGIVASGSHGDCRVTEVKFIDPGRPSILDAVSLAGALGRLDDDGLRAAEMAFRAASEGWQVRFAGSEFVEFKNGMRTIPLLIARIIADHRESGCPFLGPLERLRDQIDEALAVSGEAAEQIIRLEDQWKLEP